MTKPVQVSEKLLEKAFKEGCDAAIQEIITSTKGNVPTHYTEKEKEHWLKGYNETKELYEKGFNTPT